MESFLFLFISVALIILGALNYKISIAITKFEFFCIVFILYLVLRSLFTYQFDISFISYLLFLAILYFGLKAFFLKNRITVSLILFFAAVIILLIYIIFAICYFYNDTDRITNQYLQNKSIFSILLASQIALAIPLCLYFKAKKPSLRFVCWILLGVIVSATGLLGLTNGRSGWLGFSLAIFYIAYHYLNNRRFKKAILYFALPAGILFLVLLVWYKQGSSNGRLLIYKVSAGMLKDHWIFGIGSGQFKVQYNQSQAAYFATHSIDSKEALLADTTFYAFNDFFQFIIENGLPGFLILVAVMFVLVQQIKQTVLKPENKHLFIASTASFICIVTGSLFSYPLQIFPIVFQAVVCLSIIGSFPSGSGLKIDFLKNVKIPGIVLLLIGVCLCIQFYFYFQFSRKSLQAFELGRSGFKQRAIEKYKELNDAIIKDGNVLYLYAQQLYYSNQPGYAAQVLSNAKNYYCSNNVYKLSAEIENELKHYSQAEKDYQTAVYMVPNRMLSRY
ncbi:MAG: O-antigen ligase family protein, partial [Bacteroidota bacterium]|nr:O-antigen ligase family protein [Bacteroidota bacterium]